MTTELFDPTCPKGNPATEAAKPLAPFALSERLAIGRQPTAAELQVLADAGFRALLNNRPDGEAHAPMTSIGYQAATAAVGFAYAHIPVEGRNPLERDVRAFAAALETLPKPIYACCHSGGRSTALWVMASVDAASTEALIAKGAEAGFDVSGLRAKMDMRRAMLADGDDD